MRGYVGLLVTNGKKATVDVPNAVLPIQVQVPVLSVPAEKRHLAMTVLIDPVRADADDRELALDFGIGRPERQELIHCSRTHAVPVEVGHHIVRVQHLVEMHELEIDDHRSRTTIIIGLLEIGVIYVAIRPLIATILQHLLDGLAVVHGHCVARVTIRVEEELLKVLPCDAAFSGLR